MSQRSIIEINHDSYIAIKADPMTFARLLGMAINSSSEESWARLKLYGITHVVTAHHSTERKVVIMGQDFPL